MLDLIIIIFVLFIGAFAEHYFQFVHFILDFAQENRPKPKIVHDVEILPRSGK